MSFAATMSDFGDWWLSTMRGLPPLRDADCSAIVDCTLIIDRRSLHLQHLAGEFDGEISQEQLKLALTDLASTKRSDMRIELILRDGHLTRPLGSFRLPRRRAREIARLDIQSSTPIDLQNAHIMLPRNAADEQAARFFVIRRNVLAPIFEAIGDSPCHVVAIKLKTDGGLVEIDPEDYRHLHSGETKRAAIRKLTAAAVIAAFAGLATTFVHAYLRYSDSSAELDTQIASVEAEAKAVRALISKRKSQLQQVAAVRGQKQQTRPVAVLWEEVSRVLPDTAWVSDFSVKGQQARLNGFSTSASGLISRLDASPIFAGPTFTTPVVKSPEVDAERFSIGMDLER